MKLANALVISNLNRYTNLFAIPESSCLFKICVESRGYLIWLLRLSFLCKIHEQPRKENINPLWYQTSINTHRPADKRLSKDLYIQIIILIWK